MKSVIAFALLVAAVAALPVEDPKAATIYKQSNSNIGVGPYFYNYQSSDGKSIAEEGKWKDLGADGQALEIRGQYSYQGPDGIVYTVTYVADENGYRAEGAHIPKN